MKKTTIGTMAMTLVTLSLAGCPPAEDDGGGDRVIVLDDCGDGTCAADENPTSCPSDCSVSSGSCGDGVCAVSEDAMSCPSDCSGGTTSWCGDGGCDADETYQTCPQDCSHENPWCDDGECDPWEDENTCPEDCAGVDDWCGDGTCDADESESTCPQDCDTQAGRCGDGTCDADETEASCPQDCEPATRCGDGTCNGDETTATCPQDCPPACERQCTNKTCGDDGCGGVCGTCRGDQVCTSSGTCELPPPPPESFAFTVTHDANGPRSGDVVQVTSSTNASIHCAMDDSVNYATIEMTEGDHTVRMFVGFDPIGFCLFSTPSFDAYDYVETMGGGGFASYGVDSLGNTSDLRLSCTKRRNGTRLEGEFSSGRLFRGKNSSASARENVQITNGTFACDLN